MDTNYLTLFELCSIHLIRAFLCPYLYEHNQTMLKNINQPIKETMTNQQLKNKVILSMKKDNDLKKYVKDMQELSNENFDILVKIIDGAYNKVKGVK